MKNSKIDFFFAQMIFFNANHAKFHVFRVKDLKH